MSDQKKQSKNEEEEKPLVEESIKYHQESSPTVGSKHSWRQEGPHLICRSCESVHGFNIGMNQRMTGEDENGKPIIVKV